MHIQPLMVHALDEPSAYEVGRGGDRPQRGAAPVDRLTARFTEPAASRPDLPTPEGPAPWPSPPPTALDNVVSLAKRRGFVYPCGEIYGGTRSAWDYGPLGVELKENIKRQWWKFMVTAPRRRRRPRLQRHPARPARGRPRGHLSTFSDPLIECQSCHKRFREDHLQEDYAAKKGIDDPDTVDINESVACPNCGTRDAWTEPRNFNMMLKTYLGVIEDESGLHYLRPETAQGIFLNFANVVTSQPPEAAVRHRPDGQELPQRDHARQLHLPHPRVRADGDGVLRQARRGRGVVPLLDRASAPAGTSTSASTPTTCATTSTRRRSCRTTPRARPTSSTASGSPAVTSRSSRASPTAPTSTSSSTASSPARTCPTTTRPPTSATCPTSSSRPPASPAR